MVRIKLTVDQVDTFFFLQKYAQHNSYTGKFYIMNFCINDFVFVILHKCSYLCMKLLKFPELQSSLVALAENPYILCGI